jgi:hypothetical protein
MHWHDLRAAFLRLVVEFGAEDDFGPWSRFKRSVLAQIERVDLGTDPDDDEYGIAERFRLFMAEHGAEDDLAAWSQFREVVLAQIERTDRDMDHVARQFEHEPPGD